MERLQNRSWSNKYASHALYVLYQKLQINNKNKFWKTVRLTSVKKKTKQNKRQLQSSQYPVSLSIGAFTAPYSVITTYFQRLDQSFVFLCFTQFGVNSIADCLNFDRWRQLRKCPCNIAKANRSKNVYRKTFFKPSHLFCWLFEEAKLANNSNPELD